MASSLFGWNINAAESPPDKVLDIVRRTKARSHTVMHGMGLARQIHDVVGNTTGEEPVVVCREDWPDQDWAKFRDVRGYVSGWKGRGGYWPDANCYFLNEPVVGGDVNRVKDLLRVCIDFMNEAASKGLKAVVGNFPDASLFEHHWLDNGVFDEFLRVASQWTNAGHGYIGHHNYSYGTSWTGSAGVPYSQLKTVNPQPPTQDAFQRINARHNWLQGRFMFPLLRCDTLGIPRYRFVCTEGVWDRMPNGEAEGWIPGTEAFWGLGKLRGPLDQRQLWAKQFPDMSPAKAGVHQLKALAALMDGLPCVGVHLFTLSNNPEWTTFNFLNWPEFIDELATYAASAPSGGPVSNPNPPMTTPVPKPTDAGTPVQARLKSGYNLRYGPSTRYGIVTVLAPDLTVTYYPNETTKTQADGFEWVFVEALDKAGFVAHQGQFDPLPPVEPTTFWLGYPLQPGRYTVTDKFNAPRNYSAIAPTKLQLHEGMDFGTVPPGNATAPVLACQNGIVESVGNNPGGYGIYVRLKHVWTDGETWRTWYGHLSSASVAVGNMVGQGDRIGTAGMSGNADGVHVHLTLTNDRRGLDGYVVDKVVNPEPFLRTEPEPEPEPDPIDYKALSEAQAIELDHLKAVMAHQANNFRAYLQQQRADLANIEQWLIALESPQEELEG